MSEAGKTREDFPDCPDCETDVFVSGARVNAYKYVCNYCHEKFGRREGVDIEEVSNQFPNNPIDGVTDKELDQIYDNHTHFGVPKNRTRAGGQLHLLHRKGTTYCKRWRWDRKGDLRKVEKAVYPKGYLDVCKECLKEWRENQ